MKIFLSLFCMTLAMLLHPGVIKNESGSAFRTINMPQVNHGYGFFESMAITSEEDFKDFLKEMSARGAGSHPQGFIDTLLKAQINFDHEVLVFLRHTEGSSAVRVLFEPPVLKEKTLICEIRSESLGMGPQVVAYHCFTLVVSKSLVDKVQLNTVGESSEGGRSTILLSTTERQPLNIRRDPPAPLIPAPSECPKLIIGCPTDLLQTGKTYVVKLVVEGGNLKDDVTYNWSVTGGQIVGGQGTRGLVVRINEPDKILEAWVSLGGVNPHCNPVATCSCGPSR